MRGLQKCGREGCPVVEVPNRRWWVVALRGNEFKASSCDPRMFLLDDEHLVCGEACLTREFALWTEAEHARRRREERQAEILEGIEKQFEKQL